MVHSTKTSRISLRIPQLRVSTIALLCWLPDLCPGTCSNSSVTPDSRPSHSEPPTLPRRYSSPQFLSSFRSPYTSRVVLIRCVYPASDQPQTPTESSCTSNIYVGTGRLLRAVLIAARMPSSKGGSSMCPGRILTDNSTRSTLSCGRRWPTHIASSIRAENTGRSSTP